MKQSMLVLEYEIIYPEAIISYSIHEMVIVMDEELNDTDKVPAIL